MWVICEEKRVRRESGKGRDLCVARERKGVGVGGERGRRRQFGDKAMFSAFRFQSR